MLRPLATFLTAFIPRLSFPSSKLSLTYQLSPRKPVFGAIRFFFFFPLESFSKKRKRADIVGIFLFLLLLFTCLEDSSNLDGYLGFSLRLSSGSLER